MYTLIMASINYRIVYHTYSNKLKKNLVFCSLIRTFAAQLH